jgi:hypothetical protein
MKFLKKSALLAAVAILGSTLPCGTASAKPADRIILTPQSPGALIVLKTDWWQPAPSMMSAFKLIFSTYADGDEKLTSNMFSGNALVEAKQKNFVEGYLIAAIKPGRWVIQSYSQQDKWALCFNASSLQFAVRPGEVVYLGKFNALFHRRQLTIEAVKSGRTSLSGYGFADFFDLPNAPRFESIDEAQMTAVKAMLTHQAPGITAPVTPVTFSPASFGTGSTLFAERKCGGYFNSSAKKKPAS